MCQVNGNFLIVFCHLLTEIAAAAVNDQIVCAVGGFIYLNEMIAAAECAETAFHSSGIAEIAVTFQLLQVESLAATLPNISAGRYEMCRLVELFKINITCADIDGVHSAANINADNIRHNLISDCHCSADCAAHSGMDIRHDSDLTATGELIVTHSLNLIPCCIFNGLCK